MGPLAWVNVVMNLEALRLVLRGIAKGHNAALWIEREWASRQEAGAGYTGTSTYEDELTGSGIVMPSALRPSR